MSLIKMLSPAYWYLLAAKLGARVLLIGGAVALMLILAAETGAIEPIEIAKSMLGL